MSFGRAHVFYPEATPRLCTAALLVEVDPIDLRCAASSGSPTCSPWSPSRSIPGFDFLARLPIPL